MSMQTIDITVNGISRRCDILPNTTLLELIREELRLTGTKRGCDQGHCGACTVLMDEAPVNACLVLAVSANGKSITTIENVAEDGKLHAIQRAFVDEGAVQCGFCTPGMVLSAKALLDENPDANRADIIESISGNLCRCTGYKRIVAAVERAADTLKGDASPRE